MRRQGRPELLAYLDHVVNNGTEAGHNSRQGTGHRLVFEERREDRLEDFGKETEEAGSLQGEPNRFEAGDASVCRCRQYLPRLLGLVVEVLGGSRCVLYRLVYFLRGGGYALELLAHRLDGVGEAFNFALQSYDALLYLSGVGVEFENYLLLAYSHVMSLEMRTAIHPKSRRRYTSPGK